LREGVIPFPAPKEYFPWILEPGDRWIAVAVNSLLVGFGFAFVMLC
jgi:hypothetical protein